MITYFLIFVASLIVLLIASDKFVDAAERIGLSLGIPSFIIGVTVVAFGTSLPELATSIASVYNGTSEVVIGNVIGSNITNILLVLGASAVIGRGIKIDYDIMNTDMPMLIGSAFLLYFCVNDMHLSTMECVVLLAALVIFLRNSFHGNDEDKSETVKTKPLDWLILVIGAALVYFSADYTILGMTKMAEIAQIPTHVIAITAVALGTSLPEVIVSIAAARKGNSGIAVGNVLGSNIFNAYAVMGIPGLIGNLTIPAETLTFSVPFMVAVSIMFALMIFSKKITIWEGWLLLLFYVFFIGVLLETQIH